MITQSEPRKNRWSRLLLLAGGVGIAWCALTMWGQAASASAAQDDDASGLLGAVASTIQETRVVTAPILETVESVVEPVLAPAPVPATPPAPAPAPAPAVAVVHAVTTHVVAPVIPATLPVSPSVPGDPHGIIGAVDTAIDHTVDGAIEPLLTVVHELPLVGTATDNWGLREALGSIVGAAHAVLGRVVDIAAPAAAHAAQPGTTLSATVASGAGAPARSNTADPSEIAVPLPRAPGGGLSGLQSFPAGTAPAADQSSHDGGRDGTPLTPLAPVSPIGPATLLTAGASTAAPPWAALADSSWRAQLIAGAARSFSDDALPGAPVFATDVSPD